MQSKGYGFIAGAGRWIGRGRAGRILLLSFLLTALTAVGMWAEFRNSLAQSGGAPDYSTVDDFTNGLDHLLRNDDLLMTFYYARSSGEGRNVLFTAGMNDSSPTFESFDQQKVIPNGQAGCTDSNNCYFDYHAYSGGNVPAAGRFFEVDRDTSVIVPFQFSTSNAPQLISLSGQSVGNAPSGAKTTWLSTQDASFLKSFTSFLNVVADFNGDGYDDLLMGYSNDASPGNPTLRIATAAKPAGTDKPTDPSLGFTFGPEFSIANGYGIRKLGAGDFDGDGQPEIAELFINSLKQVTLATYRVDPTTLTITAGVEVPFLTAANTDDHPLEMAIGHFTSTTHDQIVTGSQLADGDQVHATFFDFIGNSIQPQKMSSVLMPDSGTGIRVRLQAARFDWSSPYDQIAWMSSSGADGTRVSVLTVDPNTLVVTRLGDALPADGDSNAVVIGMDMTVGNFDHMKPNEADPTKTERDPNLQIAVGAVRGNRTNGQTGTATIYIYGVSEDYKTLTLESQVVLDEPYFGDQNVLSMSLSSIDMRGRSFRLGAGYKVTIDQTMPTVVLAVPPMHTDYVSPGIGQTPTVLNLSVVPDAFTSVYEESGSTTASFTDTETTSSSFAGEESLDQKVALGSSNPFTGDLENGVTIEDTFTAKQDLEQSQDTINGDFNSTDFDVSQNTGLSDVIWYRDSSYYLYVYPVIGRRICPAAKSDRNGQCADSDKVPLRLMFSAPKESSIQRLASDTVEWYQPPWEFGNLLSYPAGLAQLKQYLPDINLLTEETGSFATDDAGATIRTTWSNGRSTGINIDHKKLFTENNDLSVQGNYSVKFFGQGGSGETKLDLNFGGSDGTNSLTESTTQFNSARGITITKTASFANPGAYKYFFSPFIFGKVQPVGYTDPLPTTAEDLLVGYGTLRSAFTVDPIGSTGTVAGGWWSQSPYKQFPDVAVNHPNRWSYGAQLKPSNGVIPSNCIGIDNSNMDCVTPNERVVDNPWLDPFHDMRGFFITDATNPPNSNPFVAGGGGAQLEVAKAGDKLTLSTRVYNYSFTPMPAGTKVKVRFYGMEWNTTNNFPADAKLQFNDDGSISVIDPGGKSFLIGETSLSPIPAFNNGPQTPLNWALASQSFDTTPYENMALVFWVAVWMEDASGNLVREVASHGLTGIPASTATPFFRDVAALEQMVNNPLKQSDSDPAQVSFSNNIGFYKSAFHILPSTSATSARAEANSVGVESVRVSGASVQLGKSAAANVMLRGGAQDLTSLTVYFYDGDPTSGGRLIDAERIGRLRAGARQSVNILFRPKECGSHQLFIRVTRGGEVIATGRSAQALQVNCAAPVCIAQVCMKSPQYYALNSDRLPRGMVSVIGGGIDTRVSTSDTTRMRLLLQGGASQLQRLNQQYVATQLSLLGQPGGYQSALQSNLLCYKVNFQPFQIGGKTTISPSTTLGELFDLARTVGNSGRTAEIRLLANLFQFLNGNDPQGRCR